MRVAILVIPPDDEGSPFYLGREPEDGEAPGARPYGLPAAPSPESARPFEGSAEAVAYLATLDPPPGVRVRLVPLPRVPAM